MVWPDQTPDRWRPHGIQEGNTDMVDIDRRAFVRASGAGLLTVLGAAKPSLASAATAGTVGINHVRSVIAVTRVYGSGQKFVAITIEYDAPIVDAHLSKAAFEVAGRIVTGVHTSDAPDGKPKPSGRYVIVELSIADAAGALWVTTEGGGGPAGSGSGGPGAGSSPPFGSGGPQVGDSTPGGTIKRATASVTQRTTIVTTDGTLYRGSGTAVTTNRALNLIVDEFRPFTFQDPGTGRTLRYNLFVPRDYDPAKSYPLVLFMHDAGVVNVPAKGPLVQGLGAVCWASPEDQAKHPCFVVAPEYPEVVISNAYRPSSYFEATVNLAHWLTREYSIDRRRVHATGQSMGAMLALGMNVRHPGWLASSYIVAGQWQPDQCKPLAKAKLWIVVPEDDSYAYPTEDEMMGIVAKQGTKISRATWNGRATEREFAADVARMEAKGRVINYAAFKKGTVFPRGATNTGGGSGHMDTWHIAYDIPGIRDWIMRQSSR